MAKYTRTYENDEVHAELIFKNETYSYSPDDVAFSHQLKNIINANDLDELNIDELNNNDDDEIILNILQQLSELEDGIPE